jgi:hypothetical protein
MAFHRRAFFHIGLRCGAGALRQHLPGTRKDSFLPVSARIPFGDILSLTVATVLLLAASLKGRSLISLLNVSHFGLGEYLMTIVAVFEAAIALWLFSGFWPSTARRAAVLLLSAFSCYAAWRLVRGERSCGCFGDVTIHPLWTLMFDLVAVFLLIFCRSAPSAFTSINRVFVAATVLLCVAILHMAIYRNDPVENHGPLVNQVSQWIGKKCPLLEGMEPSRREELSVGRHTLIVFDHNCDRCREYLRSQLQSSNAHGDFVLIDIGSGSVPAFLDEQIPTQGLIHKAIAREPIFVPVEITLASGIVADVRFP